MRILCLHSNSIEYEAVKKAIKEPEEIKEKKGGAKECLAVFLSAEERDEADPESVAERLADEVKGVSENLGVNTIVLYPYVHLTSSPSKPGVALGILDLAEKKLKDYTVYRSPFGWYKSFKLDVKGHPLAELSREFGPGANKRKGQDQEFEPKSEPKEKDRLKLTSAAIIGLAAKHLYPETNLGLIDLHHDQAFVDVSGIKITDSVLKKIEKKAKGLIKKGLRLEKKGKPEDRYQTEIKEDLGKKAQVYSLDGMVIVPVHRNAFVDTKKVRALAALHTGSAYWRGNADNPQLARIYCTGFSSEKELNEYLERLEKARERSHTVLGEKLKLFTMFEDVGKGLPVWLPRGEVVRREVERLAVEKENEYGYERVSTPVVAKGDLFRKSGHLPYYEDSMYPAMAMDDGEYYLKAMNCPIHHLIFSSEMRSYRDMPLRIAEYGLCHRNELSGTLTGLQRVRSMNMNDAHIYCRKDQIEKEVENVIRLIQEYYEIFGLEDYWFRLSLSDLSRKGKYIDQPENWKHAEKKLREVLKRMKVNFVEAEDEAAFYGPKIDIQFRNVFGREDTMSTVQLDFVAKERFGLFYVDDKGSKNHEVFVIHRAPLSTHERFMAFLIEHYNGNFPLWLSPEQVRIVTVADRNLPFARSILKKIKDNGIRASVDERNETMGKKVWDAQVEKVNYIVTIGDKEEENKTLAVRSRDGEVEFGVKTEDFIRKICEKIATRN